jgi:hypothetical protein
MKIETWTQVGVLVCAALVACGGSDDVVAADAAIQETPKVVVQNCSTDDQTGCPDGYKCGLYVYNSKLRHACLLLSGSVGEGQVCSPSQDGMFDDCGPGLICSLQVGSTTVCERLCTGPAACGPGRACFVKFTITDGRCLPGGCDLFDTGSWRERQDLRVWSFAARPGGMQRRAASPARWRRATDAVSSRVNAGAG